MGCQDGMDRRVCLGPGVGKACWRGALLPGSKVGRPQAGNTARTGLSGAARGRPVFGAGKQTAVRQGPRHGDRGASGPEARRIRRPRKSMGVASPVTWSRTPNLRSS